MRARSLNPIADHAAYEAEQEHIERTSTYLLTFNDLLESDAIYVRGIPFDVTVYVTLKRDGSDGPIQVDYIDYKHIYIVADNLELIEVASPQRGKLGNMMIERELHLAILNKALAKAKLTPEHAWERKDADE